MRELVTGNTIDEVRAKVDKMKERDWTPVSDIRPDTTRANYNNIRYVCVMQKEGEPSKRVWGRTY